MPNPTTSTVVHNAANELTNWNGATLTYDGNGNLLSDGANTYGWNERNQLDSISGTTAASFVYDPFGRRQQKTINGNTTNFLYDGVNPVQVLAGGSPSANLLTGLGVDQYFQRTDLLGTSDFLTDALGSTLALADPTGTVQTQYTYDPFGGTTTQGAANANSFRFTGRENDGDGLYFYRARYYSPMVGRFVSQDPVGFEGGFDTYGYANGDPTLFWDPLGLCPPTPGERIELAAQGLLNLGIGAGKIAGGAAVTGETGGLGAALGIYGIVSGAGNLGVGISQIVGAATGDIPPAEQAAEAAAVGVSPSGLTTLVLTNGNLNAAATAAEMEGLAAVPFGSGLTGEPPSIPDVADAAQSGYHLVRKGGTNPAMAQPKCPASCR